MAKLLLCLVLCILSVCVYGQDPNTICPPLENIHPCICYKTCEECQPIIKCSGLKSVEELNGVETKSGDYPFAIFTISDANIPHLPVSALDTKQIKVLNIVNSSLVSIFDVLPPETAILDSLHLHNLKLQHGMRWELLYQLHSLNVLTVSRIDVPKIEDSFGNTLPKQLRVLYISRTKTSQLGTHAFAPLRNLNSLVVRNSLVRVIQRSMFPKPYRGTVLDFSYNKIQNLPDDIFSDMPSLKSLLLNNNNIAVIPEKTFSHVGRTVSTVPLRDNPIRCDCRLKWIIGQKRLPYIDAQCFVPDALQGKNIRDLKTEDFGHCKN